MNEGYERQVLFYFEVSGPRYSLARVEATA